MSGPVLSAAEAVRNTHLWFETNSGWAPPDPDTLTEWMADDVCRCPDECLVRPEGWCEHGLASWWLVLSAVDDRGPSNRPAAKLLVPHPSRLDPHHPDYEAILRSHEEALAAGEPGYTDPSTGLFVMTARYLWERRSCCDQGCRHCPFVE